MSFYSNKEAALKRLADHPDLKFDLYPCDKQLKADKDVVLAAVKQNGWNIQYALGGLNGDREVVRAACWEEGAALKFTPWYRTDDKSFAIDLFSVGGRSYTALSAMSSDLSNDKDVVMAAVGVSGVALSYAADELRQDKDVVLLALHHPGHGESSFSFAAKELRADKGFVLQAVAVEGSALQFACDDLRDDIDVVLAAVRRNGLALEYASDRLRQTGRIVEAAVQRSPQALKWALGGLNQDLQMLQVAGFFVDARKDCAVEATLSVRFSFAASATTYASDVPLVLRFHEYMKKFLIYNPNLFCKKSCDPEFTNFDWPCRGTIDTCKGVDKNGKSLTFLDSSGKPSNHSCWRFSFRYHLSRCKATGGFMLQVEEFDGNDQSATEYDLGAGQKIETEMAELEGLKIFRIRQGTRCYSHPHPDERRSFDEQDADDVARAIMAWYDSGCIEKRLEWIVLRRTGPNGEVLTHGTPTVVTFADGKPGMDLSYGVIDYSPIGFQPAGTVVVWP